MSAETHSDSDRIDCPHGCGNTLGELWDYNWGSREEIEVECDECGKPVVLWRRVSVDYTAKAISKSA